jgi:hypothetical protein
MRRSIALLFVTILAACSAVAQKAPAKKPDTASGSTMDLVITRGSEKTDVKSSTYATHDGYLLKNPDGKFMIFFGAGSTGDGPSFTLTGQIDGDKPGTYAIGGENSKAGFNLQASVLKGTTMLVPNDSGEIVITSFPLTGGFVTGTLHAVCQTVTEDGEVAKYDVNGTFKLIRR